MKQYLKLLEEIKLKGVNKKPSRENMPSTLSLFGYQFRHDLSEGFPLLTTKKLSFKNIVVELLWFLKGDTNIKYLIDNGCNIWNEDAYNYYRKIASQNLGDKANSIYMGIDYQGFRTDPVSTLETSSYSMYTFEEFIDVIKEQSLDLLKKHFSFGEYTLGDCGFQYGKVWREWNGIQNDIIQVKIDNKEKIENFKQIWDKWVKDNQNKPLLMDNELEPKIIHNKIDQIKNLIISLKNNPESRRHLVTSIDPAHDKDLALYWCHVLFQFNCRPLSDFERKELLSKTENWKDTPFYMIDEDPSGDIMDSCDDENIPKYYLDCQLYQRSADVFLGVPYNIASYALLTNIISKICNMIPGEFIHTFGDVHIYDNHIEQVNEQLNRSIRELPKLEFSNEFDTHIIKCIEDDTYSISEMLSLLEIDWFKVTNYDPHPKIKGKLSTGLK